MLTYQQSRQLMKRRRIEMAVRIALAGNPNCGKTTMFNALTGASQYVGNWPGVTVEKKEGFLKSDRNIIITDLPGIYSLSPYTLEEAVSRDYLLNEQPEAVINIVDATNIERNLYLTTQILELGIPVVIALNMMDIVKKKGGRIDTKRLSEMFGCAVVETSALKETGLDEAVSMAVNAAGKKEVRIPGKQFSNEIEEAIDNADRLLSKGTVPDRQRRWYDIKLLEKDPKVLEHMAFSPEEKDTLRFITGELEKKFSDDTESIITNERYDYIGKITASAVRKSAGKLTASDKIDRIVTNRILGIPIFILVMFIVYWISISSLGTIVTDFTNDTLFGAWIQPEVRTALESAGDAEELVSLVTDGIIGGIGSVLGFVPQMAILFLMLSILEDCGYMVRIAFIMDRVFRKFGLSGKSFIPLLISSGCGVPGIMSSKTIENDNDRRLTIMTATFIPCGAKLPVIALIAGIMMGGAWWMAPLMYFIGIAAVLTAAVILKKTKPFSGEAAPFVMELPEYHIPSLKTVLMHVWERLRGFLKKAGTVLFLACIIMWFLSSFGFGTDGFGLADQEQSLLAGIGALLAPLFAPLGFGNWRAVASSFSGLIAKESIVSTISILCGLSEEAAETDSSLWSGASLMFTSSVAAFSFLVFNLLDSPCLAAISTMAKEMQSKKWTSFAILFQNVFAYCVSMMIYQFGMLFTTGAFGAGTVAALMILALMLYMLLRKDPYRDRKTVARRSVA